MAKRITSIDDNLYEHMLNQTLVNEVEKEIMDEIIPSIKAKIRNLAISAVEKWSTEVKYQEKTVMGFDKVVQIEINFVEKVIETRLVENNINITVKDEK